MIKSERTINRIKKILHWLVGIFAGTYLLLIVLLHMSAVQRFLSRIVEKELQKTLHTEVSIGRIDLGMLNRIIIDDICLKDQQGRQMFKVTRLSCKYQIIPLFNGKIVIDNVRLFTFDIRLSQADKNQPANFQFLLDALASDSSSDSNLSLRINSILLRRGQLSYHRLDTPETPDTFNTAHLVFQNINANFSLKAFDPDSINIAVKKFSFSEQSGLYLKNLSLKMAGNKTQTVVSQFGIELTQSSISTDSLFFHYQTHGNLVPNNIDRQSLSFRGGLQQVRIMPTDFKCFLAGLQEFDAPISISTTFQGDGNQITINRLRVNEQKGNLNVDARINLAYTSPSGDVPDLSADIKTFLIQSQVVATLAPGMPKNIQTYLPYIQRAEYLRFNGRLDYKPSLTQLDGTIATGLGAIQTEVQLKDNKQLKGHIESPLFQLGQLLNNNNLLGEIAFDLQAQGNLDTSTGPSMQADANISRFVFKQYTYNDIQATLSLKDHIWDGRLLLNDPNAQVHVDGQYRTFRHRHAITLSVFADNVIPDALNLTTRYPETAFSAALHTRLQGKSIDDIQGHISLADFVMRQPDKTYTIDSVILRCRPDEEGRHISLNSDFLDVDIEGDFRHTTLVQTLQQTVHNYLPTWIPKPPPHFSPDDYLFFQAHLTDVSPLQQLLDIPVVLHQAADISGYLDGQTGQVRLFANLPDVTYDNERLQNIRLLCENPTDSLSSRLSFNRLMKGNPVAFSLNTFAHRDSLNVRLIWDNQLSNRYKGDISTIAHYRITDNEQFMQVDVRPTQMIINDTIWNIRPSVIDMHNKRIRINNFRIEQDGKHLNMNGYISSDPSDSLQIDLKSINLQYVFNIINFHAVEFAGLATGQVYANGITGTPEMSAHLIVDNFTFNEGLMGRLNASAQWNVKQKAITLKALMNDPDNQSNTYVDGSITPGKGPGSGLNLNIKADRTNLYFLNTYTKGIFTDLQGRCSGWTRVFGPFKQIDIEGRMMINEARMKVNTLNTVYTIQNDSIIMRPGVISFRDCKIYDHMGDPSQNEHYANLTGELRHRHFSRMEYDIDINAHNLLGYDWRDFGNEVFYGTVYATGRVGLWGKPGELHVDVNVRPEEHTTLVYNASSPETVTDNQFINFVSCDSVKTDTISPTLTPTPQPGIYAREAPVADMHINFNLDITPDATIKILMDARAGDYISLYGHSNLQATYYNKGQFRMYGSYRIDHGMYKLSLQNVIRKDFQIRSGSTLTFGGPPYEADLNLQAVHTVPSVSLNDLSSRAMFNQSNVRVNCIMNITGKALKPQISFDFDLPNVNEDEKQMVRSLISTEEEKNMQIIYLLGIGRFYTYDYTNTEQSQSSVAMKSLLSSTLSGQLNQMLSSIVGNSNWSIGTNLSTGEVGWSDMDVEGLLSGRLLNNRLLINGNFGYRDNSMTNNSNFIGDFDLQWLLTKNGNISLKAYSATNDRYFTKSSLTTQGIGLQLKKDFISWKDLFRRKHRIISKPAKKRHRQPKQQNPATAL